MYHRLGWTLALLALCTRAPADDSRIRVVAEQFWPYSYTAGGSYAEEPQGVLIDFAVEVLERAGLPYEVSMLPWPRVMKYLREYPNQLVITIIRSPEREQLLHWIGPVADISHALYGLRGTRAARVTSLEQARHLSVATVADDIAHDYLVARQFERLVMTPTYLKGLEMLARGRVDLYPGNQALINYQCGQLPDGCGDIELVLPLEDLQQQLHFGLSAGTQPAVVARVRQAFEELRAAGRLQAMQQAQLTGR